MGDAERDIPAESRRLVEQRDRLQCARCYGPGSHWHHRRSRRVRAEHRHCACNGLLMCVTCHRWAHDNPEQARATGFIVSAWVTDPYRVPVVSNGYWQPSCNGFWVPVAEGDVVDDGLGGFMVVRAGLKGGPNAGHTIE